MRRGVEAEAEAEAEFGHHQRNRTVLTTEGESDLRVNFDFFSSGGNRSGDGGSSDESMKNNDIAAFETIPEEKTLVDYRYKSIFKVVKYRRYSLLCNVLFILCYLV